MNTHAVDTALAALADPTRRTVIDLLREQPQRAGELAQTTGVSPPAMSRHLRVLRASGLVEVDPPGEDARIRLYRLRREAFAALRAWLDQVDAFWAEQLDAYKAHVEREGER